jgi:hypothetical protein
MSRARSVADLGNQNVLTVSATDGNINVGTGVTIENTGEAQFSGIVTAQSIDTRNLIGDVSVGGVLTYEDVTSVDSVGIITARNGLRVTEGGLVVTAGVSTFVGLSTFNNGLIVVSGVSTLGNTVIGGGTTELVVTGDARVTGILTVGTSSFTINGAVEYPTIRPTLDLNFAATKTLDRRITFTRDGVGTFTDDMGIVRYASNNVPRFDHDVTTGESLGLLIEESRTNYTYHSITPNASTLWYESRGVFSNITTITSPDGTTDGLVLFAEDTQTGPHHMKTPASTTTETIADGTTVTSSIWVKKYGSKRYISFGINKKDDSYARTTIDLDTGAVSDTETDYTATSTAYPNGWYRITVTGNGGTGTGRSAPVNSLFLFENGTSSTISYTGDGSSGVYVWGPQMEIGSFATSFIPTRDSNTVTRSSDQAKITGTNFTDFYNQTEGTFSVTAKPNEPNNGSNYYFIFEAADSSDYSNAVSIGKDNGNTYRLRPMKHSNLSDTSVAYTTNSVNMAIAGSGSGDGVAVINGTVTATSTGSPSGTQDHNVLHIGNRFPGDSSGHYYGTIKSLKYYNKRLPNAQLQGLTA